MKTFKDAKAEMDSIEVVGDYDGEPYFYIITTEAGNMAQIRLDNSTAPALALAILEAAGFEDSSSGGRITGARIAVGDLRRHVANLERAAAEAKEQAELEAEALELCNAAVIECGNPPYPSVERMDEKVLRRWLAVARKSREMRKP